jgi:hypothetical protein
LEKGIAAEEEPLVAEENPTEESSDTVAKEDLWQRPKRERRVLESTK